MTIEYGDNLKYLDWPQETEDGTEVDWKLDENNEKQVEANLEAEQILNGYLKDKLNVNKENSPAPKEQ